MMNEKQAAAAYLDGNQTLFINAADRIWEYAELSLKEYRSARLYCELLKNEGFQVMEHLGNIETCFSGSFGKGRPRIAILGEFDALSGLAQEAGKTERTPIPGKPSGHGCGHNLLGAGALSAAFAVKQYLESTGKPGTVVYVGCPGEEGGASKAFLAREGYWKQFDAALTWHPGDANEVATGSSSACIQVEYRFDGIAAHAAGNPDMGRSGLDAAELMNIGVQYLREHMPKSASVHYAMTDSGGVSPNVVQAHAAVLYMVRDDTVKGAIELKRRVDAIAEGAALMTGTEASQRFIDGLAELIPNFSLEKLLYQNFETVGAPGYAEEEWAFAEKVKATYPTRHNDLPGCGAGMDRAIAKEIAEKTAGGTRALNDFLMPRFSGEAHGPGSTDVGDVSYQTPTAQIHCVSVPSLCPGHSWQEVTMGKSTIAHKGMITAGKVLANTAIDLFENPALLDEAKAELLERTKNGYNCPIPDGAVPTIV